MRATLDRADLLRALARTHTSTGDSDVPILGTALLRAEGDALSVTTTDLALQATASAPADVEVSGLAAPPVGRLYDVVRRLPDRARVLLELLPDGLQVRAGRARFTLPSLPPGGFPAFPEMPPDAPAAALPGGVAAALAGAALTAAARDEDPRMYLRGGYLHAVGSSLRMVATDGHRLVQRDAPLPPGAAALPPVIVPRRALAVMGKLDGEATSLRATSALIQISADNFTVTSKLVDGAYPDYTRIVPLGNDRVIEVNRGALAAAAARMQAATERGYCTVLTAADGELRLSVRDLDFGASAEEDLACDYSGEEITIGLNSRYLAEALAYLQSEVVTVAVLDERTPVLIQGRGEDDVLVALSPMRVA